MSKSLIFDTVKNMETWREFISRIFFGFALTVILTSRSITPGKMDYENLFLILVSVPGNLSCGISLDLTAVRYPGCANNGFG